MFIDDLLSLIEGHRCYSHPVFQHWAEKNPSTETIGALFHQIRNFCDSTRPELNLPLGLRKLGLSSGSDLLQKIAESEEDHGPQLATMAGHILNRSAGRTICPDLYSKSAVEGKLKEYSDQLLGSLPGYDKKTGLMPQTRAAMAVFERRSEIDEESVYRNLGAALGLEKISYRQLIPGEKHCLVDSGLYGTTMDEPEMYYLLEHHGEAGAEAMHEQQATQAIASVCNESNQDLIRAGADEFLDTLTAVWDLLDSALLESGVVPPVNTNVVNSQDITNRLKDLWQEVLDLNVGTADDFFKLGGDSVRAIRMIMEVQKEFKVEIDVENFFLEPTIARLVEEIRPTAKAVPARLSH